MRPIKIVFDLTASVLLLILLSPLILMVALLIKVKLGSPVIFTQTRPGLKGKPYKIFKFRTMTNQRDSNNKLLPADQRLTSFGNFLRKYSLDEFPQLLNVIKLDQSLIGPRPLLMEYLPLYTKEQMRRHDVLPGITGWAQVNGRNSISWQRKFELDIWYVDNYSLLLDIKILFLTVLKVLRQDDINFKGDTIERPFTGVKESS